MQWLSQCSQWLLAHPIFLWISSILLGGAVSIFSGDIRRFLSIPPQRLTVWILKARLGATAARLEMLVSLNHDLRKMVLYLFKDLIYVLVTILFLAISISGEGILQRKGIVHTSIENKIDTFWLFMLLTLGTAAGSSLYRRVNDLLRSAEKIARLESKIGVLRARLEGKTKPKGLAQETGAPTA